MSNTRRNAARCRQRVFQGRRPRGRRSRLPMAVTVGLLVAAVLGTVPASPVMGDIDSQPRRAVAGQSRPLADALGALDSGSEPHPKTAQAPKVPPRPSLSVSAGEASATLSASVSNNGGSAILRWQYRQRTGLGSFGQWVDINVTANSISHTVTGLPGGVDYRFRVRAVNAVGNGVESNEATVRIERSAPPKPSLSVTKGDTAATLSAAVAHDGGSRIQRWQYRQKIGEGSYGSWMDINVTSNSVSHTVTGLTNGKKYTFRVRAVNSVGNGDPSDPVSVTLVTTVPPKPSLSAFRSDTTATLTASVAHTGGSPITGWEYRQKEGSQPYGQWLPVSGSSTSSISFQVTGLKNGTTYGFKVRAVNAVGNGVESDEATVTLQPTVPPKPTLSLSAGNANVTLTAMVAVDGGTPITKWSYQRKSSNDQQYGPWIDIFQTGTSVTHTVSGLTNATMYTFKVRAVNGVGNGAESDEQGATPAATKPPKPKLSVSAGNGKATLFASLAHTGGSAITKWQYEYKTGGDYGSTVEITSTDSSITHQVTGLTNSTAHTFRVRAVNDQGDSADSEEVSVTPLSTVTNPPKPSLSANAGHTKVILAMNTANAGGSSIVKWQYKQNSGGGYGGWTDVVDTALSTTHPVIGLTNGTAYAFKVRAVNGEGESSESDEVAATPAITVPSKPSLSASGGNSSVTLSAWVPDTGGRSITRWQYQQKTGGSYGTWRNISSGASSVTHTVRGLTNGTGYTFRVRAVNAEGNSAASAEATATPSATVPSKASLFVVGGNSTVTLSASVSDTGGHTIARWQYQQKTGQQGSYSSWRNIHSRASSIAYTVRGLTNGTAYTFRVRAVNPVGNGAESDEATMIPSASVPSKPSLTATSGNAAVALTATVSNTGGSEISRWQYRQRTDGEYGPWIDIVRAAASMTHAVTGLENGITYTFKVRAVNSFGNSAESNESSATTSLSAGAPSKPALSASAGDTNVLLRASVAKASDNPIEKWEYQRRSGGGDYTEWLDISVASTSVAHTVLGLGNGVTFTFRVRAVNSHGPGEPSDGVVATPAPLRNYFVDDNGSVHERDINAVAAAGIAFGCDSVGPRFCPDDTVSRAQIASFLARSLNLQAPTTGSTPRFEDIEGNFHAPDINAIAAAGITAGCNPQGTRFCPNDPVTRAQMASLLVRAFGLSRNVSSNVGYFADTIGNYHLTDIRAIAAAGITLGCDSARNRFCPDRPVTRAQMASFLARSLRL